MFRINLAVRFWGVRSGTGAAVGVLREPRDDVVFHVSGSFGSDFVILLPVFSFL